MWKVDSPRFCHPQATHHFWLWISNCIGYPWIEHGSHNNFIILLSPGDSNWDPLRGCSHITSVAWGSKKPNLYFVKVFFQRACRIILGPPKHVLHLVWSPFVIYTAIRTALKEAWEARILGKRRSESKNKKIKFWNGTKCKICFTHLWSYFRKKK